MNEWVRTHKIALILAVLVSVIYGSHHFLMPLFLEDGQNYHPVTKGDEAGYYALRANAVMNGDVIVGDIAVYEYQESPAFLPMLNPVLMGFLGNVSGGLERGFIVADFIFPPLIFLVLYLLAFQIFSSFPIALLFSSLFIFSPHFALYIPPISVETFQNLLHNFFPILGKPGALYFARFEYPKLTFLFYALALFFTYRALKRKDNLSIVLAGINFGIMFYTYLFDWAYFLVGAGIMAVIVLLKKDYEKFNILLKILGMGLLVSMYYWVNLWQLKSLPQFQDIFYRIGVEISDSFRWVTVWKTYLRNVAFIGLIGYFFWKKDKLFVYFLGSFLAAYFIVVNVQVVTGFNPHPDHWYRIGFIFAGLAIIALISLFPVARNLNFVLIFIAILFAQVFYSQYLYSTTNATVFTMERSHEEAYRWLREHTPKNSVIATINTDLGSGILLHTHNKLFLPSGGNTVAPNEEIWERLIITSHIFGFSPEEFSAFAEKNNIWIFQDYFIERSHDRHFKSGVMRKIPDEILSQKIRQFKNFNAGYPYKLDYILEEIGGNVPDGSLEKVYENDTIRIYKATQYETKTL